MVKDDLIRQRDASSFEPNQSTTYNEGDKIEARYKGRSRYYPGVIARVHHNGTCDIDYDDGEKERMVPVNDIKDRDDLVYMVTNDDDATGDDSLCVGNNVEAYNISLGRFCSGIISRVYENDSCDIVYNNGEKSLMVERNFIKAMKASTTNMDYDYDYSDEDF